MAFVRAAVVVPVKAFRAAKVRLAGALSPAERERLARAMAAAVIAAADPLPVVVVCDHDGVREWAIEQGAKVLWTPGLGLDGAVSAGVDWVFQQGFEQVIVAHADLPLATDLAEVGGAVVDSGAVMVPDRHGDGTNVLALPAGCGFGFAYGYRSFERHRKEADRLGLTVTVLAESDLSWDVDVPADLVLPDGRTIFEVLALDPPAPPEL